MNDTLTLLNMGGVFPHQRYTVVIRGNKITLDWTKLPGKTVCVTGVFELYKNQPQIAVADPSLITVKD
jgi:DNA/RNA endonuclease YhcR with UshA esterase domain